MGKRAIALMVGALITGLLVAGCGGGDSESDETISQASFVRQAKAVCAKRKEKLTADGKAIFLDANKGSEQIGLALFTKAVLPNLEAEVEELRELGTPRVNQDQLETIFVGMEDLIDELKSNPEKIVSGGNPYVELEKQSKEFGISTCPFS